MNNDKKSVSLYLPIALAEKVEHFKSDKEIEETVLSYFADSKRDFKVALEGLDDEVVQYKALMMKARQAFREAKDEQLEANYQLWEKYESDLKTLSQFTAKAKAQVEPIKREMEDLNKLMQGIDNWKLNDLLKTMESIRYSMEGETGKMLKFLFENYKK